MATYIKTLKEDNGDITYPQTVGGAVLLSGGTDLESELNDKATVAAVNNKIDLGDVQSTDMTANSVTTNAITDLNVTTAKLANGAVTGVANNASVIGTAKLALDTVGTPNLRDDSVTMAKMNYTGYGVFARDNTDGSQTYSSNTVTVAKVPNQIVQEIGCTYNSNNGQFTITQPGIWILTGGGRCAINTAMTGNVRISINGDTAALMGATGYANSSTAATCNGTVAWVGYLAANDVVELRIQASGSMTNNTAKQQHIEGVCIMPA